MEAEMRRLLACCQSAISARRSLPYTGSVITCGRCLATLRYRDGEWKVISQ